MPYMFNLHDLPLIDDRWETSLDLDVLIHTHPKLVPVRDRFARAFNAFFAQESLRSVVFGGLRGFARSKVVPADKYLHHSIMHIAYTSLADMVVANGACKGLVGVEHARERERKVLSRVLGAEAGVNSLVGEWDDLDPVERMRHVYALWAAQVGEQIPFADNAAAILAAAFGGEEFIARIEAPALALNKAAEDEIVRVHESTGDFLKTLEYIGAMTPNSIADNPPDIKSLHEQVVADMMHGLIRRLENDSEFVDALIDEWVLPKVDERFERDDRRIEEMRTRYHEEPVSRAECLAVFEADEAWLALAEELGSPLPS